MFFFVTTSVIRYHLFQLYVNNTDNDSISLEGRLARVLLIIIVLNVSKAGLFSSTLHNTYHYIHNWDIKYSHLDFFCKLIYGLMLGCFFVFIYLPLPVNLVVQCGPILKCRFCFLLHLMVW